jgi:tetratricopeptide (TPR) repeat protein
VSNAKQIEEVRCTEELIVLPTYPVQEPDLNPMFFENRIYQGSSGRVYPNAFTDRVSLDKQDVTYRAIFLENEYVQLMILPEIGGRIHTGLDKTNGYDFFYRQKVIKPALVGLLGPWISGGVEFNWPQHHRPSTYMPVHSSIQKDPDGSCTVWLSEHDPMLRMKGMVGVRLAPGKAIVEARVRLYNRTPLPQTFLWWANVAVRVHDQYQAFFPPDVHFVADHAKRAVSSFPIARNHYYGVDYRPGTDITWYKNIPVPTSYMVIESKYDFCGGYDHAEKAGLVHTSNHFIAPGKKLWTWGNAEFGYAWDRNLSDDAGPYLELMAGAYTDNQPDFSWLQPYETKTFSQYWYPIQKIGPAKNANTEAAINLDVTPTGVQAGVCVTSKRLIRIVLTLRGITIFERTLTLVPGEPLTSSIDGHEGSPEEYCLSVFDSEGRELISYRPESSWDHQIPDPAREPPAPADTSTIEELYLIGLHLELYRHATRGPESYYDEGLNRDPDNARLNNAKGLLELRKGRFAEAEAHFARAAVRLTFMNPNPYDGEAFYNLGLTRLYQKRFEGAYAAFYKAAWNYAWKSPAFYSLACISVFRGHLTLALEQIDESLLTNSENLKALALKGAVLRRMSRGADAQKAIQQASTTDSLDFRTKAEQFLLTRSDQDLASMINALHGNVQILLDIGYDLAWSGLTADALDVLEQCGERGNLQNPMVSYTLSWLASLLGKDDQAIEYLRDGEAAPPRLCFPSRLEEMIVLQAVIGRGLPVPKAHYYLGNLFHDKRRYDEAISQWRRSVELDDTFSIPLRNLAIAEFNVLNRPDTAMQLYDRAFAANAKDARLLYEWDQLKKRTGLSSPEERLTFLSRHRDLVNHRDDLTVEYVTLLNQAGQWPEALEQLATRRFSPWEGGEGLVSTQYVIANRVLGKQALMSGHAAEALRHFDAARHYPENLGEGKHLLALERDLDYYSGLAAQDLGNSELAVRYWAAASAPLSKIGIHSYFQALALRALDNEEAAQATLSKLLAYGAAQLKTEPKVDYFATSLPNLLLFKDDLARRNRLDAQFLIALARHGMGAVDEAVTTLREISAEDPNNSIVSEMLRWFGQEVKPSAIHSEAPKAR